MPRYFFWVLLMGVSLSTETNVLQLTPGPTNLHPDVQEAVGRQTLNHTHPDFLSVCKEVQGLVQKLFGTQNEDTGVLTCSGTGGNEAGVMNFVQPRDKVICVNSGFFSGRLMDMIGRRYPREIIELETEFGETLDPNLFEETLARHEKGDVSAAFIAQIETSAGTQVPDEDLVTLGAIAARRNVMLCIDSVCAFGGAPVNADTWQAAYVSACSQKGVNAPPGTAPFTLSPIAMEHIRRKKALGHPPGSLYFDLEENMKYWRDGTYHATPGVQGIYALRRALEMTFERAGGDLPKMFEQHAFNQRALETGLEDIGFVNPVEASKRAAVVSVLRTPKGVDAEMLRRKLLQVKEVRGRPIAGVEVAAGKRDPGSEIRMALLGLWSSPDTVLDACDAMDQVTGKNRLALGAAEKYFTRLRKMPPAHSEDECVSIER